MSGKTIIANLIVIILCMVVIMGASWRSQALRRVARWFRIPPRTSMRRTESSWATVAGALHSATPLAESNAEVTVSGEVAAGRDRDPVEVAVELLAEFVPLNLHWRYQTSLAIEADGGDGIGLAGK